MVDSMQVPWLEGSDFYVIINDVENLGRILVTVAEIEDFRHCINVCNLEDHGFKGRKYT